MPEMQAFFIGICESASGIMEVGRKNEDLRME